MIALVFCGDLRYCPYIHRYISEIEAQGREYRVYFWNRCNEKLKLSDNYRYFDCYSDLNKNRVAKIFDFIKFRRWLLSSLKKDQPNGIIVLSTLTGIFMGKYLYAGKAKYIFDIRDYSYEHIKPFYRIEEKIIDNSIFTAISSKGFETFLPKHNYVMAHNFNRNDIVGDPKFIKRDGKIKFVWNGSVRYFEFQKQYLNALKNDDRFEMIYHGSGPELKKYQEYCSQNEINNVVFTGAYDNSNKAELLADACILNNCYGFDNVNGNEVKYAISNRFYDGIIYHIPQLVEEGGYKAGQTLDSGLGVTFSPDEQLADKLYEYYTSLDEDAFDAACEIKLEQIKSEDDKYITAINSFIRSVGES